MSEIKLTPDQEARAKQAFAERRFDPESYQQEIMGPEVAPELQVRVAEATIAALDGPAPSAAEDLESLARQKQRNDALAREFCFLDPEDYADAAARTGKTMTVAKLLDTLRLECKLTCWFSLASEAMIGKELNARDVALAYRKIGQNPENIYDPGRWRDAIAEIRQEEADRQPMYNYERLGLQVVRAGATEPTYVCWLPGALLREYALVKFDAYGVPDFQIPGWRDAVIALIRHRFITQEMATEVFGEATGPASRRYNMILNGLRNAREVRSEAAAPIWIRDAVDEVTDEPAVEPCPECTHRTAHFLWCSQFEAWLNEVAKEGSDGQ